MRNTLGLLLCAGILAWATWFVAQDEASLRALAEADPVGLAAAAVCTVLFLWSNGLLLNVMIRSTGTRLGTFESLHLSVVTNAGNSFLPLSAGMGLRALYLNKRHGVALGYFLGSLLGIYIVNFLIVFSVGAAVTGFLALQGHGAVVPLLCLFGAGTAGLTCLVAKPGLVNLLPEALRRRLSRMMEGWQTLLGRRALLLEVALLSALNIVLSSGLLAASFHAVGETLAPRTAVYLSSVYSLGIFVKITPGNLGVSELILLGGGATVDLDPRAVLLASAVSRAVQYVTLLVLAPIAMGALFGRGWTHALRSVVRRKQEGTAP